MTSTDTTPSEQAIIAALLRNPSLLPDLPAVAFGDEASWHLFSAIRHLADSGAPIDPGTVAARVHETGFLDAIGGAVVLYDLARVGITSGFARHVARVKAGHRARTLAVAVERLQDARRALREYEAGVGGDETVAYAGGLVGEVLGVLELMEGRGEP